jgi:predicted component of type VI protein secretion system
MRLTLIAFAAALALTPAIASAQAAASAAAAAHYSVDNTTIAELLADPAAKAAVEKHVPGMLSNDQIEMAKDMTLKQIQQFAPDNLTDKTLGDIDAEFAKLPAKK